MPRGTQFSEIIDMFREEAGYAMSRALGQNDLPGIKAMLRRSYRRLHADFNWPHLQVDRDKEALAGQRYYTIPADIDFSRILRVRVRENGGTIWHPIEHGITLDHYNRVSSDDDQREDFPRAWQVYENDQFEVWPIPVTSGHKLRFTGISKPKPLVSESEVLDLDDDLVVMYAVAQRLARDKSPDAKARFDEARQHYMRLRANSQKSNGFNMKVSSDREPPNRGIDIRSAAIRDADA